MEFTKTDLKTTTTLAALAAAPIFKKQGTVRARPAVANEQIVTKLASGQEETTTTAKDGEWVVTNPGGEQYMVRGDKFDSRYEPTAEAGVYQAKGFCRAIVNPFGFPIAIDTSWGEQKGDEHCLVAINCDATGKMEQNIHLIETAAFAETYKQV
ncbi:MAG: hypothetical protein V4436_03225 [Patescibacteria group bacterium]